jgi:Fe2+ or Zn2+ uptake regulation protein
MDVQPPQSLIAAAQAATGYQVTGMSLQFVGLCPSCQRASLS